MPARSRWIVHWIEVEIDLVLKLTIEYCTFTDRSYPSYPLFPPSFYMTVSDAICCVYSDSHWQLLLSFIAFEIESL